MKYLIACRLYLRALLGHNNIEQKVHICPTGLLPPLMNSPPHHQHPTVAGHLLQLKNLHWHVVITQSPQFTVGSTLGAGHSMDLDECIYYCILAFSNIQSRQLYHI